VAHTARPARIVQQPILIGAARRRSIKPRPRHSFYTCRCLRYADGCVKKPRHLVSAGASSSGGRVSGRVIDADHARVRSAARSRPTAARSIPSPPRTRPPCRPRACCRAPSPKCCWSKRCPLCSPEQNLPSASGFTITHYLMQSLEIFYDEFNCVRFGNFLVREPNTQQRLSRLSRHILSMTNSLDYAFRVSGYSQLFPKLHVFFVLPHGGTIGRTSAINSVRRVRRRCNESDSSYQ